ncbi:MAG: translation initiation factor IF-5A, partial [Candidatus Thermoplasmatota archaeon]|nr:translation initiation factor IF-5A [Candidatus Thermoplasmatota archaeon]
MSWQQAEVRELKEGRYVLIDDQPCKILSITTSKPGKHGEAKARIEAVGVFDGQRRSIVHPVKHKIQVPQMDKRKAQVLAIMGDEVQLMDLETFETFNLRVDEEQKKKLSTGSETFYVSSM